MAITHHRPVRWKEETKRKLFAMGSGVVDQRTVPMAWLTTQEDTHRAEEEGPRERERLEGLQVLENMAAWSSNQ